MRLVLASASPRRADLLRAAGFTFDTLIVDVDERPRPGEASRDYVRRLAAEKSAAGLARVEADPGGIPGGSVVLGADTVVVVDGRVLGKPRDDRDAAEMLQRLSGRRHEVMTGVSVRTTGVEVGGIEVGAVETTGVEFAPMRAEDIDWYVASGEWRDKAGAYAIQGLAGRFIPVIEGSYSNVVGLPIAVVHHLLGRAAALIASGESSGYSDR